MPIFNRPYMRGSQYDQGGGGGLGSGLGLPKPTKVVKYLLIANLAVFVLQLLGRVVFKRAGADPLSTVFGVTVGGFWQVWRYLTFQFLHDTNTLWHLGLNMLGVYMFGSALEGLWGSRRFLVFYLSCGALAGVAYVIIGAAMGLDPDIPIIGASGGVYGIILACAVLFPHFRVFIYFFPVPIRLAAVLIFGGMVLVVFTSISRGGVVTAMSDVAHLGGAVAGAIWLWTPRLLVGAVARSLQGIRQGAWQRKMQAAQARQEEIDRILRKIHEQGLNSLTGKERRLLRDATRTQQRQEHELRRL
jgi:membrane associated rhomboid family serine protease